MKWSGGMKYILDILSDQSERVPYNHPSIPIYTGIGRLSNFFNHTAPVHWHDDVELSIVLSGEMAYNVNGNKIIIGEGNGVFINSRQFHSNFRADDSDCEYLCLVFHPLLLSANHYVEKNYVFPVISNLRFPHTILRNSTRWQCDILTDVQRIYQLSVEKEKGSDILIQSLLYHLWSALYIHMPDIDRSYDQSDIRLTALHSMLGYLQKHFDEKITLQDIAAAGNVCQSNCCIIFNDYLHQTPIQYLIGYRLNKSTELLKNTTMNITEIAISSGFSGLSYFAETFRKHFGLSPSEYRNSAQQSVDS